MPGQSGLGRKAHIVRGKKPEEWIYAGAALLLAYTDVGRDWVTSRELTEGRTVRLVAYNGLRALYLVSSSGKI
jgi:hypothetical protein